LCVHIFLFFRLWGKLLTSRDVPRCTTRRCQCVWIRTCASIFFFSAIFAVGPCLFLFFLNVTGSTCFSSSSFDCGLCRGNHLAFLWDSFDTSYSAYPRRPFVYCTAVLSTSSSTGCPLVDLYVFMYVKDFFDRTFTTYERSVEN